MYYKFFLLLSNTFVTVWSQTVPLGVSLSKAPLYQPSTDFTCLDGSSTVPFSYVNDDYCDCSDGSDEPGTAACPNGIFHCINSGYEPLNIPTSRVNDGICDCCDASDELPRSNCTNTCAILGAEARRRAEKFAELMVQGNQLRLELSVAGKQLRKEKQERIASVEAEKVESEQLRSEAEKVKLAAEQRESAALEVYRTIEEAEKAEQAQREKEENEKEAFDVFKHLDSNNDDKLQVDELVTRQIFDQNKDGEVSSDELKFFIESKSELTWEDFYGITWPRLKPFHMMEKGLFTPPQDETQETVNENENENENEDEGEERLEEGENEEDWEQGTEEEETEKMETESETEQGEKPEENSETSKYDEETQRIIEEANKARTQYENAERAVQDLDRELGQLREALVKDYGIDDEFAPLDGQCFSYSDREYTYKLCPFDQVVQMGKSGGSETRLGVWKNWSSPGDYSSMIYDKGQSCWNGPQRSTKVLVSCGLESAVIGAAEPNKCEYVLDFKTPAACRLPQKVKETHDEL